MCTAREVGECAGMLVSFAPGEVEQAQMSVCLLVDSVSGSMASVVGGGVGSRIRVVVNAGRVMLLLCFGCGVCRSTLR